MKAQTTYFKVLGNVAAVVSTVFLVLNVAYASTFKPVITNYSSKVYGIAYGMQNWGCTQTLDGEMHFANNRGMLSFDGYHWRLSATPGNKILRTMMADGDSIFVGSYEEFGYFKKDKYGNFQYCSLSKLLRKAIANNEEVWNIVKYKGKVYFQTFASAFCWNGRNVEQIHYNNLSPLYFHLINGKIYAQIVGGGLALFDGKRYIPIIGRNKINNDNVVATIQLNGRRAILCTESSGLYLTDGKAVEPFPTQIDTSLKQLRMNRAILTKDSTIVLGTILGGIYAIDMAGRLKWHYNIESGMLSNSVLRLFCDRDNNVWAALDNGLALIHTGSPYSIMIPERGEPMLGMIYDIGFTERGYLIATNQGLYTYDSPTGKISLLKGAEGQNWHVSEFDGQIFIGNNQQTFETSKGSTALHPIPGTDGSSTCMKRATINGQDVIVEASYSNLRIYRMVDGRWTLSNTVEGFSAPVKQMEIDQTGAIWAANMNSGVYRIELSRDLRKVTDITEYRVLGNDDDVVSYVMKIRGRIVLSDGRTLYTYDDMQQRVIPYKKLCDGLASASDIHSSAVNDRTFWLSGKYGYTLVDFTGKAFHTIQYVPVSFFGLQNNESNDKVKVYGGYTYFNMNNGIARFSNNDMFNKTEPKLALSSAQTINFGETIPLPISLENNKTDVSGGLSLIFSFPNYSSQQFRFRFTLDGPKEEVVIRQSPDIIFHDLDMGRYILKVEALNAAGNVVSSIHYGFTVPRPPYLSYAAIFLYIAALSVGIFYFSRWRTNKALKNRQKDYEAKKALQDIKMLEQEKIIAKQRQQLLENELSVKSKEIASMALDMEAKKNALEGLQTAIQRQKLRGGVSSKELDALLKQIETIPSSDEDLWKVYQKNFDMIHDQFFRNLRERYPSLTASDLKFCALLRLNLSTKDIARLTNLTIRGVEAARYRLRKKIGLSEKDSLVEFLIDFK